MKTTISRFILTSLGGLLALGGIASAQLTLDPIAEIRTGVFDEGANEIVAYAPPPINRLYITNSFENRIDVYSLADLSDPVLIESLTVNGGINSVAVQGGIIAVAAANSDDETLPGTITFFGLDGTELNVLTGGALPDMVTFSPSGRYVLFANEGEPNDDITVDPEGSIGIIDIGNGSDATVQALTDEDVQFATFTAFNDADLDPSVRVFLPGSTVAQDLEPEYIVASEQNIDEDEDGMTDFVQVTAYAALQENNALAVVDVNNATVTSIVGLGFKRWIADVLDASDRDDAINFQSWPVLGMYQPDALAIYQAGGQSYIVSANEGDARDYDGFSEEARVEDVTLDPVAFPNAAALQTDETLGRLEITTTLGDNDFDGDYEQLYAYGARSFSIWDSAGNLVYDSGSEFERYTAGFLPDDFNSDNDENGSFDSRSDAKGPEPEGIATGRIGSNVYAFIGMERLGGVFVYDVTNPQDPFFVTYVTTRDFAGDAEADTAGNLGPEGLIFIPAEESPNNRPLLVVTYEVSGSTAIFEVQVGLPNPAEEVRSSLNIGGSTYFSAWFGTFSIESDLPSETLILHREHGFIFLFGVPGADELFFFDAELGFVYTTPTLYPFLYRFEDATWYIYGIGSGVFGEGRLLINTNTFELFE